MADIANPCENYLGVVNIHQETKIINSCSALLLIGQFDEFHF